MRRRKRRRVSVDSVSFAHNPAIRDSIGLLDPTITPTPQATLDSEHLKKFRIEILQMLTNCGTKGLKRNLRTMIVQRQLMEDTAEHRSEQVKENHLQTSENQVFRLLFEIYGTESRKVLANHLRKVQLMYLKKIHQKYCSSTICDFGKARLCHELEHYFYYGSLPTFRREEEAQILRDFDVDNMYFVLCDFTLPKDLMEQILSFLPRDKTLLASVGLVSYDFYVLVLSTWRILQVKKHNLFRIPSVVMQAARVVKIVSGWSAAQSYTAKEVNYLADAVSASNLTKMVLVRFRFSSFLRIYNPLVRFAKGTRREPGTRFTSLRSLVLQEGAFGRFKAQGTEKQIEKFDAIRLVDLAPGLESVVGAIRLSWCVGLTNLRVLRLMKFVDRGRVDFPSLSLPNLRELSIFFGGVSEIRTRAPTALRTPESERPAMGWIVSLLQSQLHILELITMRGMTMGGRDSAGVEDAFELAFAGMTFPLLRVCRISSINRLLRLSLPSCEALVLDFCPPECLLKICESALHSLKLLEVTTSGTPTELATFRTVFRELLRRGIEISIKLQEKGGGWNSETECLFYSRKEKRVVVSSRHGPGFAEFLNLEEMSDWHCTFYFQIDDEITSSRFGDILQKAGLSRYSRLSHPFALTLVPGSDPTLKEMGAWVDIVCPPFITGGFLWGSTPVFRVSELRF